MIKKNQLSFESERAVIKHKQTGAREINDSDKKKNFIRNITKNYKNQRCIASITIY